MRRGRGAADVETSGPRVLTAALDRSGRLSEGALVQASVRARLLGIPLLRLDATVVLMPTTYTGTVSAAAGRDGLAEAVRSINDGAAILARIQRDAG